MGNRTELAPAGSTARKGHKSTPEAELKIELQPAVKTGGSRLIARRDEDDTIFCERSQRKEEWPKFHHQKPHKW